MDILSRFTKVSEALDKALIEKLEELQSVWGGMVDIAGGESLLGAATSGNPPAILICTNRQVIVINQKIFSDAVASSIPIDHIKRIDGKKGMLMGEIFLYEKYSSNVYHFKVLSKFVSGFEQAVKQSIAEASKAVNLEINRDTLEVNDDASQIEKLAQLRDKGLVSDDEFQAAKRKILGI